MTQLVILLDRSNVMENFRTKTVLHENRNVGVHHPAGTIYTYILYVIKQSRADYRFNCHDEIERCQRNQSLNEGK